MRLGQYLTLVNTTLLLILAVVTLGSSTLVAYRFVEHRFRARLVREASSISQQITEVLAFSPVPGLTLSNLLFLAEPDSFVRVLLFDESRELQTMATSLRLTSMLPCNLLEEDYRNTLMERARQVTASDLNEAAQRPAQFTFEAEFCYSQPTESAASGRPSYSCADCQPDSVWLALLPVLSPLPLAGGSDQSSEPQVIGYIEVIESKSFLREVQSRLWTVFWTASIACFLVLSLATYSISRYFTSPLTRITGSISRIQNTAQATTPLRVDSVRGIQEVLELAEAFQGMQRRIGAYLKNRQDMASNLSHELRNALGALDLDIETLRRRLQSRGPDPVDSEILDDMGQNVSEMIEMSNRSLAALYSETSSVPLQPERVRANELLQETVSALQETALHQHVGLRQAPAEGECLIRVDRTYFKNDVLVEMTVNAIDYSQAGGEVVLGCNQAGAWVRMWIQDSGPGVAPQHHESIFEPYFRVDPTANPGKNNRGLGLSLARGLVRQLGGDIHLDSQPGAGSTFSIVLPAVIHEPPELD